MHAHICSIWAGDACRTMYNLSLTVHVDSPLHFGSAVFMLVLLCMLCMLIPPKGAGPITIMLWHNWYATN